MKVVKKQVVRNSKVDWEKTPEYREAVFMKVLRSMKSYGYEPWMSDALRELGVSL